MKINFILTHYITIIMVNLEKYFQKTFRVLFRKS